jgi:hypothetical protein
MTNYQIYLKACRDLIVEIEDMLGHDLPDSVNSYLVNLLAINFNNPQIVTYNYDITLKAAQVSSGFGAKTTFVNLAEQCLIISGITPFVAERRGLPPKHFTNQGQELYHRAANCTRPPDEFMFELCRRFNVMRDVIGATFDKAPKTFKQRRQLTEAGSKTQSLVQIKLV